MSSDTRGERQVTHFADEHTLARLAELELDLEERAQTNLKLIADLAALREENADLRDELACTCNAEELRQIRAERDELKIDLLGVEHARDRIRAERDELRKELFQTQSDRQREHDLRVRFQNESGELQTRVKLLETVRGNAWEAVQEFRELERKVARLVAEKAALARALDETPPIDKWD